MKTIVIDGEEYGLVPVGDLENKEEFEEYTQEEELDRFCECVEEFFIDNGFEWAIGKGFETPSPTKIKEHIMQYIDNLIVDDSIDFVEGGRIRVEREDEDNELFHISIIYDTLILDINEL